MKQAAAPRGKLLNVTTIGRAREAEAHDLHALALHRIIVQRKRIDVGNQIAFPGTNCELFVLVEELAIGTKTVTKLKGITKNEILVVKQIDHVRRIGAGEKAHRLVGRVEVLV